MITLKLNKKVYWRNPDNLAPGIYTITNIVENETRYCFISKGSTEYKADVRDLLDMTDVRCCRVCGSLDVKISAYYQPNQQEFLFDQNLNQYRCGKCKEIILSNPMYLTDFLKAKKDTE